MILEHELNIQSHWWIVHNKWLFFIIAGKINDPNKPTGKKRQEH